MKKYQGTTREFRAHLRNNAVPLRYELDNEEDYAKSQNKHIAYYKRLYGRFLPKEKDVPILEIGCSEGLFLGFLKHLGYTNYTGIDLAREKLDIATKYHPDCVLEADAFDYLKDQKESFVIIFANYVLEHIPKDKTIEFLNLIYTALRKNGSCIVSVPNMDCPFGLFSRYMDFSHQIGFTVESLLWVFYEANFQKMQVYDAFLIPDKFCHKLKYRISRCIIEFLCNSIGVRNLKRCISESIFCVGYKP